MMATSYKETKIGRIPEEWEVMFFKDVFQFIATSSHSKAEMTYDKTESKISNIHYGAIHTTYKEPVLDFNKYNIPKITDDSKMPKEYQYLKSGDLVIVDASEDAIGLGECVELKNTNEEKVIGGLHTYAVRDKIGKTVQGFRGYILKNYNVKKVLMSYANCSKVYGITKKSLGEVLVVLPPLPEQKKIAVILSNVGEAIEKTDAIIEETRQLKKGLMQKLFTEGIGHTRFKETKIGRIPEDWDINRLKSIGDFLRGKSINKSEITESGFPCVRYGDIYVQYEFANTVTHFSAFIGKETADNGQKIKFGDIIFAGTGETQEDIGKCVAYVRDDEAYAGGDLFLFRAKNGISVNAEFLSYCLNSGEVGRLKSRLGQGLSIFHIYPSHLQTLEVPLPTIEEQNQIVKILSEVDAKIEKEEATKAELEQLKKGLMQVLLTGNVRVKA